MSSKIDKTTLTALGLAGCSVTEGSPVPDFEDEMDKGLVLEVGLATLAAFFDAGFAIEDEDGFEQPVEFTEFAVPDAEVAGISVARAERNPRILRLYSESGADLRVSCAQGDADPDRCRIDPDDPGTVYFELAGTGPYAVMESSGSGVILVDGEDGPMIHSFLADFTDLPPLAALDAPIADWCADCDDTWLADAVASRAASQDPWNDAVAVGMYRRLHEPSSADSAAQAVEDLLAGRVSPQTGPPLAWLDGMTTAQLQTVEDLALAEVDLIHAQIEQLGRDVVPDSEEWREDLLEILHRRDDLEGVRGILFERDRSTRLNAALTALDAIGSRFVGTTPDVAPFDDERLNRTWLRDASAWWAFVPQVFTA